MVNIQECIKRYEEQEGQRGGSGNITSSVIPRSGHGSFTRPYGNPSSGHISASYVSLNPPPSPSTTPHISASTRCLGAKPIIPTQPPVYRSSSQLKSSQMSISAPRFERTGSGRIRGKSTVTQTLTPQSKNISTQTSIDIEEKSHRHCIHTTEQSSQTGSQGSHSSICRTKSTTSHSSSEDIKPIPKPRTIFRSSISQSHKNISEQPIPHPITNPPVSSTDSSISVRKIPKPPRKNRSQSSTQEGNTGEVPSTPSSSKPKLTSTNKHVHISSSVPEIFPSETGQQHHKSPSTEDHRQSILIPGNELKSHPQNPRHSRVSSLRGTLVNAPWNRVRKPVNTYIPPALRYDLTPKFPYSEEEKERMKKRKGFIARLFS